MTTLLLSLSAFSLLCESIAFWYCVARGIPFGRVFGSAMFIQVSLPAAFIGLGFAWEYYSPTSRGLEPLAGTGFDRGLHLYYAFLVAGLVTTLLAGLLGVHRIFHGLDKSGRDSKTLNVPGSLS